LSRSIRAVATLEGAKGALVLLAGAGALSLVHRDVQSVAEQLVSHLHLDAANEYPRIFLDYAAALTDARLLTLAALAAAYAVVRLIEAYGLWRSRRWAEWFAVASGSVYIPFELFGVFDGDSWLSLIALVINVTVVWTVAANMKREHHGWR